MLDPERAWEALRAEILRRQSLDPTAEDRRVVRRLADALVEAMDPQPELPKPATRRAA